jgi:anti-sigma regulatory factor (Ser/Thr protein kinase)
MGFSPDPSAPGAARRMSRRALAGWRLEALAPVVELLVSEVVTNAVRHAGSPGQIELRIDGDVLRVEVTDAVAGHPEPRHPAPEDPSGRGLSIVDTVASRWGIEPAPEGKTVWFELDLTAALDDAATAT